ncbi:hypothetical protein QQ045_013658 [Rhodiola kirilowii]
MSPAPVKLNVIHLIVHLKQVLKRWRNSASNRVPAGHIAVYVVGASYLNHPLFKNLLTHAEEEFGFANEAPLLIPCDESTFDEVLHCVSRSDQSSSPRAANLELLRNRCYGGGDFFSDSTPLACAREVQLLIESVNSNAPTHQHPSLKLGFLLFLEIPPQIYIFY